MVRCSERDFFSRFSRRTKGERKRVSSWLLALGLRVFRELNETIRVMLNQMTWTRRPGLLYMCLCITDNITDNL